MAEKEKTWFIAPEDISCVSRNGTYPVEHGVFGVDDSDDAAEFRVQGYLQTGDPVAPAPKTPEQDAAITPRTELQEVPMPDVKALAHRLGLDFKGNISRDALLDLIDTKRPAQA